MNQFAHASRGFELTISIKKTNVMGQDAPAPPSISIDGEVLEATDHFTYLGSAITSNLSLDREIDRPIAKDTGVLVKLSKRLWDNKQLSLTTKLKVYHAFVVSTLLYGVSPGRLTLAGKEKRIECFHLRCLRRILGITWQNKGR